ncbi:MAG: glycosyltransferase family 39 protein, partial [Candidatus Binatia bacterium]
SGQWSVFGLLALLVVGAWLRLQGLDWDHGQHLHPDERFLTMVMTAIRLPASIAEYFDTARSSLNPASHGFGFFVYGTFPLFFVRIAGEWLGLTDYGHVHLVGRVASALFDLGTVILTWRLGRLIAGPRVGVAAAALVTFSVVSIQQAHFFTVDSFAAFFAAATLLALLRAAESGRLVWHLVFGASFGLMLACRINLLLLGLLYPLAFLHAWRVRGVRVGVLLGGAAVAGLVAAVGFRIAQPYAFQGPGFFDVALASDFLQSMRTIRGFVTGAADYPPSVQWIGRTPVVFATRNLIVWGLGPAWGLAALAGVFVCLKGRSADPDDRSGPRRIAALWALGLVLY